MAECQICYGQSARFTNNTAEWNGTNGIDSISFFECPFCGQYGISSRFLLAPLKSPNREKIACVLYSNRLHKNETYIIVPDTDKDIVVKNAGAKNYVGSIQTVSQIIRQFPKFPDELNDLSMLNLSAMKNLDSHPLEPVKISWTQDYAALYANHKGGLEFQKVTSILQSKGWIVFHRGASLYIMDKTHPSSELKNTGIEITANGWDKIHALEKELQKPLVRLSNQGNFMMNKIFIVHGHDHETREILVRFIEKLGLDVVILDEQLNKGRTLIEKFEDYAKDNIGAAIVLLTPDDMGGSNGCKAGKLRKRARQNVIFEYGYFSGKLGREHVIPLVFDDIELPSDIHGIAYVQNNIEWKFAIARELKGIGYDVDLNKVL